MGAGAGSAGSGGGTAAGAGSVARPAISRCGFPQRWQNSAFSGSVAPHVHWSGTILVCHAAWYSREIMVGVKLVIVVALALACAQLQCVAACATSPCPAESMPCHEHHDSGNGAPGPCAYHFVISPAISPHSPQIDAPAASVAVVAVIATRAPAFPCAADCEVAHPLRLGVLSSVVLRI